MSGEEKRLKTLCKVGAGGFQGFFWNLIISSLDRAAVEQ